MSRPNELKATIERTSQVKQTARVTQMLGLSDVQSTASTERWEIDVTLPEQWHIGVIVGPSGAGKSTVANHFWRNDLVSSWTWPDDQSVLDGFPKGMGIKDITGLLSSVGFSSPPSWLRPFHVLSNGEQFRVNMARTLAEKPGIAVVDEFTSVVDRTVAQTGSAAIAKTVRRRGQQFVAVSCHYDIVDWLQPDWVFQPHLGQLDVYSDRDRLRRPPINLEIRRVHYSAWRFFRKHHYLDTSINKAATCFVAFWRDVPVAFTSVLPFPHPTVKRCKRGHRTVCLPDFQGVGIGNALVAHVAAAYKALGYRYITQPSHPAVIQGRTRSGQWKLTAQPTIAKPTKGATSDPNIGKWMESQRKRLVASFEFAGKPLPEDQARQLLAGVNV